MPEIIYRLKRRPQTKFTTWTQFHRIVWGRTGKAPKEAPPPLAEGPTPKAEIQLDLF